jgi:hypothetical protein
MDRKQTMSNVIFSELFIFFNGLISSFNRLIVLISAHAQHMLSTCSAHGQPVLDECCCPDPLLRAEIDIVVQGNSGRAPYSDRLGTVQSPLSAAVSTPSIGLSDS